MLTELRWRKERELMQDVFPQFKPYSRRAVTGFESEVGFLSEWERDESGRRSVFGFEGCLKGSKTGRSYRVVMEAEPEAYPQCPPNVTIDPAVGSCWIGASDRRNLCVTRTWQPAQSTFANTLLVVIKYLEEHDGQPDIAPGIGAYRL